MVTIKDIAKRAGVSHGTASNVLNGRGNVSSEKIRAVQKAAQELGYIVNQQAKDLREGQSRTLAVMLPNLFDRQHVDFYTSFRHCAETQGYRTMLFLADNNPGHELEQLQEMRSALPAGVAAITCCGGAEDPYEQAGFPRESMLYVNHRPHEGCNAIGFDYLECGRALGREACRYGSVAVVTENASLTSQKDFLRGFRQELAAHPECRALFYEKLGSIRSAATGLELFNAFPPPEAVFVTNYSIAQTLRNIAACFFPQREIRIYTLSPVFTMPERDFIKYELNYRKLGREAALRLIKGEGSFPMDGAAQTLQNYGFRSWGAPRAKAPCCLSLMTLDSPTAHVLEHMARLYTLATGVSIKVCVFSYDAIHEILTNLNEKNAYDIIRLDATWLQWFAEKIYEPLDKLEPSIIHQLDTFLPGITPYYGHQPGGLYALPETPSAQMLFYRKDLFGDLMLQRLYKETFHQELRPPETFEEYNQIARFFCRRFNPASPVAYGSTLTLGNTGVAATEFLTRYFSLTTDLFDKDDRLLLDGPQALKALKMLTEIRDYAPPVHCAWWRDTARLFAQGDVAMTVLYSNYASEILNPDSKVETNVGYAMVPGGNPLLGGGSIGVCRYSAQKKEALSFIRWLCSEEVSSAMSLLGSVSPCRKTYENYQVIDIYPWLSMTERCFAESNVRRFPPNREKSFDERRFLSLVGINVLQAINGTVSDEAALRNACESYLRDMV